MLNFIYLCIVVVIISFFAVPVVNGISKEYRDLDQNTKIASFSAPNVKEDIGVSFDEMYAIIDEARNAEAQNPDFLNNIAPAAGDILPVDEGFSENFQSTPHPAL